MAKKKAAGHHGGAWKVAYADFVTAMMALFMVLWISAQEKEILISTSAYFQSPFKSPLEARAGLLEYDSRKPANASEGSEATEIGKPMTDARPIDLQFLNSVAKDMYRLLSLDENMAERPVDIHVTSDGLRITLFDRGSQPLFKGNTAEFTEWGDFVIQSLAWMIDRNGFKVVIEGHTREGLEFSDTGYSEWELSADRANAARRALTHYAVDPKLIERVTGYATTRPVPLEPRESESNQRVAFSLTAGPRTRRVNLDAPIPPPAAPALTSHP